MRLHIRVEHLFAPPVVRVWLVSLAFVMTVASTGYSLMPMKGSVAASGINLSNSSPVVVSAEVLKARMAAAAKRADLKVAWDSQRGIPSLVEGANLLPDAQPVVKGQGPGVAAAPDLGQKAVRVMGALAGLYGITDAAQEFSPRSAEASRSGYQHIRLDQTCKGLPVFGGQVIVHFDRNGNARIVNGQYRPVGDINTTPVLTAAQATEAALADQRTLGKNAGVVAEGPTLVVYALDVEPVLAYQLFVTYDNGNDVGRWRYWIDAVTGGIVFRYNDVRSIARPTLATGAAADITGNLLTQEGEALVTNNAWLANSGAYYQWSFSNTWYVYDWSISDYAYRYTNTWGTNDQTEISAGHNVEAAETYYRTIHRRNSIDNLGMLARANVHRRGEANAFWDPATNSLNLFDELPCAVDVVAHELTHGVTQYSADLVYANESGALNESMSDIFGTLVEFYLQPGGSTNYPGTTPGYADWLMGEDTAPEAGVLRDMRDPQSMGQPSRYKGTYWDPAQEVHQNDGVQNYFFYLLCEGGSGNNDGLLYGVIGIGRLAAEKVAYLTLTHYMGPGTGYSAARIAWLAAANELDGSGVTTNAAISVNRAWQAVGVGRNHFSVTEGTTTNIDLSNFLTTATTGTVLTIARISGSANLYAVTNSITITNSPVSQSFAVGSLNDGESTNDLAVFQITSSEGGSVSFELEQEDTGDRLPPVCTITGSMNADHTLVYFDFLFDENVYGFEVGDLDYTNNNVVGGISPISLTGSNLLYRATFSCASPLGCIRLRVPEGSLTDQSVNLNTNFEYNAIYTLPWVKDDFADNFDGTSTTWTRSTNVYANITTDGWRWGAPVFDPFTWEGPAFTPSGSKCWGTMSGPYDRQLNAWVQSVPIPVGAYPVLNFQLWVGSVGRGNVEVYDGGSWWNVTPGTNFVWTGGSWVGQQIVLDNNRFGNRTLQVRFRALDSAMYIDDVRLVSERGPAAWVVSASPTNGSPGTTVPVTFQIYNSTTTTLAGVAGEVTCADAGVTIDSGSVSYGTLPAGGVAAAGTAVNVNLSVITNFNGPVIQLWHQTKVGIMATSVDGIPFTVDGVVVASPTNILTVSASGGVVDWLGRWLAGDGSETSCIFQVLYAGTNGAANPPTLAGLATVDDRVLYSSDSSQPWGRFGEGVVDADLGRFVKSFAYTLPTNALVYVRAWDAASFRNAVAYGDSGLYALRALAVQSHDFGTWRVDRTTDYLRDSDGDSIPDGYAVQHGLDPRNTIQPLTAAVVTNGEFGTGSPGSGPNQLDLPVRVAVSSNRVYIADTGNNRVMVCDRTLTNLLFEYADFIRPRGIAINAAGTRLAVADTERSVVKVYTVTAGTGALVAYTNFGSPGSFPGQFKKPYAVAFGPSGRIYVADSHVTDAGCNNRIQSFNENGTSPAVVSGAGVGPFDRPLGVAIHPNGSIYVADSENHRVESFSGTYTVLGQIGTTAAPNNTDGLFDWPVDVHVGISNLLYVADRNNHRIQMFNMDPAMPSAFIGAFGVAGNLPGQFNYPQCVTPALDSRDVYVADTQNHRVQRLTFVVDGDGDGMDDVWEVLHGLDPSNPADALIDSDMDGIFNIGEFRLGTDPQRFDTNGNGAGDGWDIIHGQSPLRSGGNTVNPPRIITLSASPSGTVRAGDVVRVTAAFSEAVSNAPAPTLTLSGGAALVPTAMTPSSASVYFYDYLVRGSDIGAVNGAVSGAFDFSGLSLDPDPTTANALFTVEPTVLSITNITAGLSLSVAWNAISGGTYHVQGSPSLIVTNWMDDDTVTATSNGVWMWTSGMPTNWVRFYRVIWSNP